MSLHAADLTLNTEGESISVYKNNGGTFHTDTWQSGKILVYSFLLREGREKQPMRERQKRFINNTESQ